MPTRDRRRSLIVLNQRNRPVEVHVGRRVVRIAPLATASVPVAGERDSAQLHELVRQRVLTILGEERIEAPPAKKRATPAKKRATPAKKRAPRRAAPKRASTPAAPVPPAKATAAKRATPAKKTAAKKAAATKSTTRKSTARKSTAKKATTGGGSRGRTG